MNQQPIFILGAHKSGTTMLRNLLSGHPDLFVIPFESHFFQLSDRDVDYEYRKNKKQGLSIKQLESNFKNWIRTQNEAIDPMGDTFVTGKLNLETFNREFELNEGDSAKDIFEKYVAAIHSCLGLGELSDSLRVVEKSVENAEFALELSQMYPEARFVHIVRNPYANFVSLRKYKSIGVGYPLLHRMARTFKNSYSYLVENPKKIEHYKVVRYEDILTNTDSVMKDLGEFLQIPFLSSMLVPSHLGENWSGNSTSGVEFKGLSAGNLDKWKSEIEPIELRCVNAVSEAVISTFGYEMEKERKSIWSRCKHEPVTRYVYNRLMVNQWA